MSSKSKPAPRTQKSTTTSAEWKSKTAKSAETPTVQNPKRHGIFGLRRNSAQGVLF
jgi:hypothetical protein